jgi:hypothetical protein
VRCPSQFCAVSIREVESRAEGSFRRAAAASGAKLSTVSWPSDAAGPVQSEEECCKKSISTSVVVAVTVCSEWF